MGDNQAVFRNGSPRLSALSILGKNWALIFLLCMLVLFSLTGKNFFTLSNLQTVLHTSTIALLLAFAETFVIITGGIDLSVGYVKGLSTIACAGIMRDLWAARFGVGLSPELSAAAGVLAALTASVACGYASGVLVARFKVPPFIATLGVLGVAYGITLYASDGGFPVAFLPPGLPRIGNGFLYYYNPALGAGSFFGPPAGTLDSQIKDLVRIFPNSLVFILLFTAVLWHLLKNTRFGRHTYAIGGGMDAAVRAGIDTNRHLILIYVLSALLSGLAGIFDVFQSGQGNFVPIGSNLELDAVAAVIIGGASLMGGKGRIIASLVGVFVIMVLANGLILVGVETFWRYIATGCILIAAIIIDQLFPELF
jgi:ribose/xylose/arabinose/galactoside ABC-type transport system permease subunit